MAGPSWLVLGESFNRGWRAYCGDRSLGEPQLIDGFANGWRVGPSCTRARIAYAPNATARISYWVSGLACLVLLALVLLGRRGVAPRLPAVPWADAEPGRPGLPVRWALAFGLAAGIALGFLFAFRAGAVLAAVVALALWRGVSARTLILGAGGLLAVVVPLIYVLFPPDDLGGFNPEYATKVLGAHWIALVAYLALAAALALTLTAGRRRAR
jgi:arabinofuranan 3-O-arabinosyltransferase